MATSVLGSVFAPKVRFLAGAVSVGLTYAAITDTCAMGRVLMKLPNNKASAADVQDSVCRVRR